MGNIIMEIMRQECHDAAGENGECRQKMKQQFYDAIVDGPIIAAVKDETGGEVCIQNDIRVVFILYGELITIPDIVQRLKDAGKFVIVHLDLIGGLRSGRKRCVLYGMGRRRTVLFPQSRK